MSTQHNFVPPWITDVFGEDSKNFAPSSNEPVMLAEIDDCTGDVWYTWHKSIKAAAAYKAWKNQIGLEDWDIAAIVDTIR